MVDDPVVGTIERPDDVVGQFRFELVNRLFFQQPRRDSRPIMYQLQCWSAYEAVV